ncbi:MAG TPA: alpha/beta fold hydrolase [bacterium]|nr:alpha/beta fold hydrolase [bacterium]
MAARRFRAALAVLLVAGAVLDGTPPPSAAAPAPAAPEHVSFRTADGVILRGHLWRGGPTAVVFSHMYGTTQAIWSDLARRLAGRGHTVLTFDFRGVGASGGRLVIARVFHDTVAAVRFVRSQGARRVVVAGASMGGTSSIIAAGETPVEGLVVIASGMMFQGLNVHPYLPKLRMPKLFIVGSGDHPFSSSVRTMYARTPPPKRLIVLPTGRHGTHMFRHAGHRETIYRAIETFLAGVAR